MKEEEFYYEIDRIVSSFDSSVTAVKNQKEQLLNPSKIRATIASKAASRSEQMECDINDYFDVS